MKRKLLSLLVCLALCLGLAPAALAATSDYAVLNIPIRKTVTATLGTPGSATFSLEIDRDDMPGGTQFTVLQNAVSTNGAGSFDGMLQISVPTSSDFWNLSEGFVVREKNEGAKGWTYDTSEWIIAPYERENPPGTIPATETAVAIYNKTAGESVDYRSFSGSHSAVELNNSYNSGGTLSNNGTIEPSGTGIPATALTAPGAAIDPAQVEISVPYTMVVRANAGATPPEQSFTLTLRLDPAAALDSCEVRSDTILTDGAGSYHNTLRVRPRNGDALAALMNGFTVTEAAGGGESWQSDRTEWFIAVRDDGEGGVYMEPYNRTDGEDPARPSPHEGMTFTNVYTNMDTGDAGGSFSVLPNNPAPANQAVPSGSVTVTFDPNGGSVDEPTVTVKRGESVPLNKGASRSGWTFLGWFETKDSERRMESVTPDEDMTVYAHWRQTPVPATLNGGEHGAYVVGYGDGTVRPMNPITRAEVTMIFFRLLTAEVRDANRTADNGFSDVKKTDWFNEAVSTMARLGIIQGRGNGVFDPNAPITRAEYAAICSRFDKSETLDLSEFTDIKGHWAESAIKHAVSIGWVRGYADHTFRPNQQITRAESMTLTNRVLQRLPASASDLIPEMKTFTDNADSAAWFYLPVQEATNAHGYEKRSDGSERWTGLK